MSGYQPSFPPKATDKPTFNEAFKEAHARGGPGHVFEYKGKMYTTDRADGADCRRAPDNRTSSQHEFRATVHDANAWVKDKTGIHVQDRVRNLSYGRGFGANGSDTDRERSAYHRVEAEKQRKAGK